MGARGEAAAGGGKARMDKENQREVQEKVGGARALSIGWLALSTRRVGVDK